MEIKPTSASFLDYLDELEGLSPEACEEKIRNFPVDTALKEKLRRCLAARDASRHFMVDTPTLVGGVMGSGSSGAGPPPKKPDTERSPATQAIIRLGANGMTFGKYRLHQFLASGTFGEVWSAKHHWLDTPDTKPTCLKLLYPENTRLEAALDEARLMATVHHPNVVAVKEVDCASINGENIWYIEMELIGSGDGEQFAAASSLQNIGARGGKPTLSPTQAARIMLDICGGVHAAHQRQLVHRDLKPENILIHPATLQAKVTDFGIAGSLRQSGDGENVSKSKVRSLGTPAYMAPEQAEGDITIQSDVYALGAILYFLLIGHPPYEARAGLTGTAAAMDILDQIRTGIGPIPLPDDHRIVPPTLRAICHKAMAKNLSDRYASASEMAKDINAWLDHRPTSAYPPTPMMSAALFMRRYPKESIFALAIGLLTLAGTFFYVYRINIEKNIARREARLARLAADRARAAERRALHEAAVAIRERRASQRNAYRADIIAAESAIAGGNAGLGRATLRHAPALYRGWEYDFLQRELNCKAYRPPVDHPVIALRWSRHTPILYASTGVSRIQIAPGVPIKRFSVDRTELFPLTSARSSPSGDLAAGLLLRHDHYHVEVFNSRTMKRLGISPFRTYVIGRSRLLPLAWSPHGHFLATLGPHGRTVRVCRVPGFTVTHVIRLATAAESYPLSSTGGDPTTATSLEWLENGTLVAMNGNHSLLIRQHRNGTYSPAGVGWGEMFPDPSPVLSADANPRSPYLALGLADGYLVVTRLRSGYKQEPYFYYPISGRLPVESVAWSPHGNSIYAGLRSGLIQHFSFNPLVAAIGRPPFWLLGEATGVAGPVLRLTVSGDGKRIAAVDRQGRVYIWNQSEFYKPVIVPVQFPKSDRLANPATVKMLVSPMPGEELLNTGMLGLSVAGGNGETTVFGGRTGRYAGAIFTYQLHQHIVREIFSGVHGMWLSQLCRSGKTLAGVYHWPEITKSGATRLVFIRTDRGREIIRQVTLPYYFQSLYGLALSPRGHRWIDVSDGRISWGRTERSGRGSFHRPTLAARFASIPLRNMNLAAWLSDRELVLGGFYRGHAAVVFSTIPISRKSEARHLASKMISAPPIMLDHGDWVTALAANRRARVIVAGTANGYLWQVKSGSRPVLLKSTPGSEIEGIAFNASADRYAVISESGNLRIWRPGWRQPVLTLNNLHIRGHGVTWCSSGHLVISSNLPTLTLLDGRSPIQHPPVHPSLKSRSKHRNEGAVRPDVTEGAIKTGPIDFR